MQEFLNFLVIRESEQFLTNEDTCIQLSLASCKLPQIICAHIAMKPAIVLLTAVKLINQLYLWQLLIF